METPRTHRIFLLSPASVAGKRARMLLNPRAPFEIARRLHSGGPVSLGEAFAFMSGLYFRGKLAYAHAFARAPAGSTGALVITSKVERGVLGMTEFTQTVMTTPHRLNRVLRDALLPLAGLKIVQKKAIGVLTKLQ